ncbi:MAG: GNAT family N-acetyltransferase [Pseudomonadota bacterium]
MAAADAPRVLDINAASLPAVASLDPHEIRRLSHLSDRHLVAENASGLSGYAFVFADSADYDGEEFLLLRSLMRGRTFVYIDQVAVTASQRGTGVGRRLYEAIAGSGVETGAEWLCCEVNTFPPNPDSLAFHLRMGFGRIHASRTRDGREVDLLAKRIRDASRSDRPDRADPGDPAPIGTDSTKPRQDP